MPTVSMFYGIIIYIYFMDHNPPHIHAEYAEYKAQFDFNGKMIAGKMPRKKRKLIEAWIILHAEELAANWKIAAAGGAVMPIDPLK